MTEFYIYTIIYHFVGVPMKDKAARIKELAKERRGTQPPDGCFAVGSYSGGIYDKHDFVVPWTIGACNYDADLMIIGQDWSSDTALRNPRKGHEEEQAKLGQRSKLPTNVNLKKYLNKIGTSFQDCWATDAFVWIKAGHMSSALQLRLIAESARRFTLSEIEIIRPKVAVTLGLNTYKALRMSIDPSFRTGISMAETVPFTYADTLIMPVYHTGNRSNNIDERDRDRYWEHVKKELKKQR